MSFKVSLKFMEGRWNEYPAFPFYKREYVSIGRSGECRLSLPDDYDGVSNKHCLLDINPPFVSVRDSGSLNGTSLNGKKIGRRSESGSVEETKWFPMKSGDRLQLGKECEVVLTIEYPESCAGRSCNIRPRPKSNPANPLPVCSECDGKKNDHFRKIPGYSSIRKIGEGGMGMVWLVQNEETGAEKAVKYMLPDAESNEYNKARFLSEIRIGEQIERHPNIVEQYKSGKQDDFYYLLMEYCQGGNLENFMRKRDLNIAYTTKTGETGIEKIFWGNSQEALHKRIKIATHIILQVLDGLHYLHHIPIKTTLPDGTRNTCGIVHRDVKPENVLITDNALLPDVKLGDFGLAKAFAVAGLTDLTHPKHRGGYIRFIPRQQIRDYRYSKPDVDVWAAAATYYYMLTGFTPKNLIGTMDIYNAALDEKAVPIRERSSGSEIPAALAEVIDKALEEDDEPTKGIKIPVTSTEAIDKALEEDDGGEKPGTGIKTALELSEKIKEAIRLSYPSGI